MEQKREKAHTSQAIDCWRQQPVSFISCCQPAQCLSAASVRGPGVSFSEAAWAKPPVRACRSSAASQPAPRLCGEARMQLPKPPLNCKPADYNLFCLHRVSKKLHHGHRHHRVSSRFPARHRFPMEVSLGVPRFTSTPAATWLWVSTASLTWRLPKEQIHIRSCCWWTFVTRFWTPCPWHNASNANSWQKREPKYPRTELQHCCDAWWLWYKHQD